jgi:hypothetical protein
LLKIKQIEAIHNEMEEKGNSKIISYSESDKNNNHINKPIKTGNMRNNHIEIEI